MSYSVNGSDNRGTCLVVGTPLQGFGSGSNLLTGSGGAGSGGPRVFYITGGRRAYGSGAVWDLALGPHSQEGDSWETLGRLFGRPPVVL